MVSKYPLEERVKKRVYEIFLQTLADLKSSKEIEGFLEEFLTPTEKIMLAKRLSIAVLLAKNYDARTISKTLKVSLTTITSINRWIKHQKGYFSRIVEEILRKEKSEEFQNNLTYKIGRAAIPLRTGDWSERRKKLEKARIEFQKPF